MGWRIEGDLTFGLSIFQGASIQGNIPCSGSTLQLGDILLERLCVLLVADYQSAATRRNTHVHIFCFAFVCVSSYFDKVTKPFCLCELMWRLMPLQLKVESPDVVYILFPAFNDILDVVTFWTRHYTLRLSIIQGIPTKSVNSLRTKSVAWAHVQSTRRITPWGPVDGMLCLMLHLWMELSEGPSWVQLVLWDAPPNRITHFVFGQHTRV